MILNTREDGILFQVINSMFLFQAVGGFTVRFWSKRDNSSITKNIQQAFWYREDAELMFYF